MGDMKAATNAILTGFRLLGTTLMDCAGVWSGSGKKLVNSKLCESGPNGVMYKAAGLKKKETYQIGNLFGFAMRHRSAGFQRGTRYP